MNEQACLFCKIISEEIPCYKVYEDAHSLAFLDINPMTVGHTLVIPKKHYATLIDLVQEDLSALILTVQKIAQTLMKTCSAEGFNILQNNFPVAGQVVFHAHFHIVPRYSNDSLGSWPHSKSKDQYDFTELSQKLYSLLSF